MVRTLCFPGTAAHGLTRLSRAPSQGLNAVLFRTGPSLSREPEGGTGQGWE